MKEHTVVVMVTFSQKKGEGHGLSFAANFHFKDPSVVKPYSVKYWGFIELESLKDTSWHSFSLTTWIPSFPWRGSLSWSLNNFGSGQSDPKSNSDSWEVLSFHMLSQNLLPLTTLHLVWFFTTQNLIITFTLTIHRGFATSQALC